MSTSGSGPQGQGEPDTSEFLSFDQLVGRHFVRGPRIQVRADFAGLTDIGKVRERNEDNFLVVRRSRQRKVLAASVPSESLNGSDDVSYSLVVCDGMGGRDFGELASYLALRTAWLLGGSETRWALRASEDISAELKEKAQVFFRIIHHVIRAMARENPRMSGMGTTLSLAYSIGTALYVVHAGDSRVYALRAGGGLERLTRDHTMSQLLIDAGMAAPGSELAQKTKRVLTNVLGANELSVEVDFLETEMADGDVLLACTDGLTDMVDDPTIERLLREHPEPEAACRALVDCALENGGRDNVTCVVGRFEVPNTQPPPTGLTDYLPRVLVPKSGKPRKK
jgi:protein phosphatase